MKRIFVTLAALLMLAGCSSSFDPASLQKSIDTLTAQNKALDAKVTQQAATITALSGNVTVLTARVASLEKATPTYATITQLTQAVSISTIAKEWIDVKATVNALSGQVANYQSRQTAFEASISKMFNSQDARLNQAIAAMSAGYVTQSQWLTFRVEYDNLATWVSVIRTKLGV